MKVSIIIPTYNNLELLRNALSYIQAQTYRDYEIIVVDDSTNNDISNYLLNCRDVRYYHNIPSLGAVRNWNYGLSLANGEYVILHHHDEFIEDLDHLRVIVNILDKYDVVISNIKICIDKKEQKLPVPLIVKKFFLKMPSMLLFNNVIGPCACVAFKKKYYVYLDQELTWKVDSEWYYRLLRNKRVFYLRNYYICSKHGHKLQITQNINIKEHFSSDILYLKNKYKSNKHIIFLLNLSTFFNKIRNK